MWEIQYISNSVLGTWLNEKNVHIKCHLLIKWFCPNIQGRFWDLYTSLETGRMGATSGCFSSPTDQPSAVLTTDGRTQAGTGDGIDFVASKSSSIYSGSKMQAPALQVLACIRTWCMEVSATTSVALSIRWKLMNLILLKSSQLVTRLNSRHFGLFVDCLQNSILKRRLRFYYINEQSLPIVLNRKNPECLVAKHSWFVYKKWTSSLRWGDWLLY